LTRVNDNSGTVQNAANWSNTVLSSSATKEDLTVGYVALLRDNRNFRFLWLGQIISLLGDWFNLIASASLVAELSQSGLAIGGLFVVRMLAPFLASPFAGVAADRYNRKQILIVTDIGRAITVCGFLFVTKSEYVWVLYTLTAIQLGISGFFFPTRNAILPELVSKRELGTANALSSVTWSVMLAMGAALGGLVAGTWGNRPAFVVDALTFVASAIFVFQIGYRPASALGQLDKSIGVALQQYLDGFRYLRKHIDVLVIALHKSAVALLVAGGLPVIQVTIAENIFVIGEGGGISLGLMYGTVGVGTGIGPIVARRFTGDENRLLRRTIVLGYFIVAAGLLIVSPLHSIGAVLLGTTLRGFGTGIVWVFSTQLLLHLVPNHVRGRVFATEYASFTLMSATGAAIAGLTMDSGLGISGTLNTMAASLMIPGVLWAIWLALRKAEVSSADEPLEKGPADGDERGEMFVAGE
jgi:MFS family permease